MATFMAIGDAKGRKRYHCLVRITDQTQASRPRSVPSTSPTLEVGKVCGNDHTFHTTPRELRGWRPPTVSRSYVNGRSLG